MNEQSERQEVPDELLCKAEQLGPNHPNSARKHAWPCRSHSKQEPPQSRPTVSKASRRLSITRRVGFAIAESGS